MEIRGRAIFLEYRESAVGRTTRLLRCVPPGKLEWTHAESMAIFRAPTPGRLAGKSTIPAGTPLTTWNWLRAMVEHEAQHRGQLCLMLGMLGVPTPPIFGLTEEEVAARADRAVTD